MERILHIRQSARFGGLERLIVQTGADVSQRFGYDVGVLLWYSDRALPPSARETLPDVHPLVGEAIECGLWAEQWLDEGKLAYGMARRLVRFIREQGIALLHTHGHKSDVYGLLAARIAGVPIVATAHGYHEALRRIRLYKIVDLRALRAVARVIAVSNALRREIIATGVPASRVVTIHNAIDAEAFRSREPVDRDSLARSLGLSERDRIVSVVARLIPEKGHIHFLRAAKRIADRMPDVRFLIVGEGRLRTDLEAATKEAGLSDTVRFLGHRHDVAALMELSEAIILPSIREYYPNVLLEAAAAARPTVGTTVGGVPDIIVDGETGLLVPSGDSEALADAMERVLRDREWASEMGLRARELVGERFSVARMAEDTAGIYRAVLDESHAKSGKSEPG